MKIGILSDTHNASKNTRVALATLRGHGIRRLIHCGDITTPATLYLFAGWQVTFVLGNMDRDWTALAQAAQLIGVPRPSQSAEVRIGGALIGVAHGDKQGSLLGMIMSGKYAYVCYGHTHHRCDEHRSAYGVRVINPGALGGSRPETRSVCVLDLDTGEAQFIEFPDLP
ncbi:MAG: metallophosphoesterase family protein [Anaerolineae bacterium]|nr:metallophosphoesterase family protein [Anaerolineae bacterium]